MSCRPLALVSTDQLGPVSEERNATVLGLSDVDKQKLDEARQLAHSMITHPVAYGTIDHVENAGDTIVDMLSERVRNHAENAGDTIVDMLSERVVLVAQVNALRAALVKVLDTGNREAAATMSYRNARENFSDSSAERKAHERALLAASEAEREARVLLATLKVRGA